MERLPQAEILKRREPIFAAINRDYATLSRRFQDWSASISISETLNNAVLLNYLLYFHDLDNFAALTEMNHGDLRATIAQIISLAKAHPEDPFYAVWQATLSAHSAPPSTGERSGNHARQLRFASAEKVIGAGNDFEPR